MKCPSILLHIGASRQSNTQPILQFLGKNLIEENIKLNFHRNFCVPEDEIKRLVEVADKAEPLKFIKGNGEYIGVLVIEEISKTTEQTTPEGDLLSIQVEIHLKEYTGKIPENDETEKGFRKK